MKVKKKIIQPDQFEEVEVKLPTFRKEIVATYPYYIAITGERELTKFWMTEKSAYITYEADSNPEQWLSSKYEEITAEQFNDQFKKAIEVLAQAACNFATDFIVRVDSLPMEETESK